MKNAAIMIVKAKTVISEIIIESGGPAV